MAKIDTNLPFKPLNIALLTISDTRTRATDTSGDKLQGLVQEDGHNVIARDIVRDDMDTIRSTVKGWVENANIDAILTTGGTGFTGRDVTPEAIEPLFDKRMEGFSVAFHQLSMTTVGTSTLQSRATAGLIDTTFVFCLPGSGGAVKDGWQGLLRYQLSSQHMPCNLVELMPRLNEN